jgi:hypothetical protein
MRTPFSHGELSRLNGRMLFVGNVRPATVTSMVRIVERRSEHVGVSQELIATLVNVHS